MPSVYNKKNSVLILIYLPFVKILKFRLDRNANRHAILNVDRCFDWKQRKYEEVFLFFWKYKSCWQLDWTRLDYSRNFIRFIIYKFSNFPHFFINVTDHFFMNIQIRLLHKFLFTYIKLRDSFFWSFNRILGDEKRTSTTN